MLTLTFLIQGSEIDEDENDVEFNGPSNGIDDGFFDDRHIPDGPEKPSINGGSPRRGSIPFPYAPGFDGTNVVSWEIPRFVW